MIAGCIPGVIARCVPPVIARRRPPIAARCVPAGPTGGQQDSSGQAGLEEELVERLRMTQLRDVIYRLRAGESERRISGELRISHITVRQACDMVRDLTGSTAIRSGTS